MPRDYKHRANRRKKKPAVSPWLGVVTGLLIGLFVAFLVYIKMQAGEPATQVVVKDTQPAEPVVEDTRDVRKDTKAVIKPPAPRFDFYNLLPEMEVIVPESEVKKARPKPAAPATATDTAPAASQGTTETFFLQVGSFRSAEQADNLKAKLAFSGFETVVHKATIEINSKTETFHRVRVGPFNSLDTANRSRDRLTATGVDSKVVKIKG